MIDKDCIKTVGRFAGIGAGIAVGASLFFGGIGLIGDAVYASTQSLGFTLAAIAVFVGCISGAVFGVADCSEKAKPAPQLPHRHSP